MLGPNYDHQKAIEAAESRHRERHFSHIRALKSRERGVGILSKIPGLLASLRPAFTKRATLAAQEHELTDYICRLDDGSMGRVAIRETHGDWIGVCVRGA